MNYFFFNEVLKHGIANPISSILISTDLAIKKINKNPNEVLECLEQIQITGKYIQNLLKRNSLKKKENSKFLIGTTIREILILNSGYKENIIYSYQNNVSDKLSISGNKILFQEMLICILNNAAESYRYSSKNRSILITSRKRNNQLIISITDGGIGMNWLEKSKAFKKAFSMKENHSGQGLYLVKKIISKEFKGETQLISQKNRGTTVKCIFPIA